MAEGREAPARSCAPVGAHVVLSPLLPLVHVVRRATIVSRRIASSIHSDAKKGPEWAGRCTAR
eukprot:scaffold13710_cov122-Isochrysis_galbana.AAC.3